MRDFESLFNSINGSDDVLSSSSLKLLSANTPVRIYYGLNQQGFYRLAFLTKNESPKFESTRAIKVQQFAEAEDTNWVFFDLVDSAATAVYYTFCDDLVCALEQIKCSSEEEAMRILQNRYIAWRVMFRQERMPLTEEQLVGLLGELYFLRNFMIPRYGARDALAAWSGVEGMNKDFAIDNKWYEIKMASVNANSVKISSLAQLSSVVPGGLVVIRYEPMSDVYDDPECCVLKIFKTLMSEIVEDDVRASFFSKLVAFGFDVTCEMATRKYRIDGMTFYKVADGFPRIQEKDITHKEIDRVTYSLIINSLEKFKFDGEL